MTWSGTERERKEGVKVQCNGGLHPSLSTCQTGRVQAGRRRAVGESRSVTGRRTGAKRSAGEIISSVFSVTENVGAYV